MIYIHDVTMKHATLSLVVALGLGVAVPAQAVKLVNETSTTASVVGQLQPGYTTYMTSNGGSSWSSSRGAVVLRESTESTKFQAYCIDPKTTANFSETYATTDLDTFFTGGGAGYSQSGYHKQLTNGNYGALLPLKDTAANALKVRDNLRELFSYAYADSLLSKDNATAFGLAVWEIIMQDGAADGYTGFSTSAGLLRSKGTNSSSYSNDAVDAKFMNYLSALSNSNEATGWSSIGLGAKTNYSFTVYFDSTYQYSQNFLRAEKNAVPVPGTLALAGVALLGLGRVRRRVS